jgi:hypothetical protein
VSLIGGKFASELKGGQAAGQPEPMRADALL